MAIKTNIAVTIKEVQPLYFVLACYILIKAVVTGLSEDHEYCTPRDELPGPKINKRKRSDTEDPSKKAIRVN